VVNTPPQDEQQFWYLQVFCAKDELLKIIGHLKSIGVHGRLLSEVDDEKQ
jgi:hypothetical protein